VIRLSFYNEQAEVAATFAATDFRISGGVIWNRLEEGLITNYVNGGWKHRGRYYPSLSFEGRCRLLFGIPRDPSPVSEPIGLFSITGTTLRANGIAFAQYIEEEDRWHCLSRAMSWGSMRIVSDAFVPTLVEHSRIVMLNPWDPVEGIQRQPVTSTSKVRPSPSGPASGYPLPVIEKSSG
jgi:hypothetical protein